MTQTLKLNHASPRTRNPLEYITPTPSIPAFMEHSTGACSILRRDRNELAYSEQWVALNVHRAAFEELATPMEVDAYMLDRQAYLADVPQPLDARTIAIFDRLNGDDGDPHYLPNFDADRLVDLEFDAA